MVKGVSTGSSWTTDPLLVKGFKGSGSLCVPALWCHGRTGRDKPLVPEQLEGDGLSSEHASAE